MLTVLKAILLATVAVSAQAPVDSSLSFFLTSVGSGQGGNLGGLAGADKRCQDLATAAGAGGRVWKAYLSTQTQGAEPSQNAKDRIGLGPWFNAKKVRVAQSVAELHGTNNLGKQNSITEKGTVVNGRGDNPNQHDILTGSQADGTAFPAGTDRTCNNWRSATTGGGQVGHHDKDGTGAGATSWNSAHASNGCSQANLVSTGGAGYFYCFASDQPGTSIGQMAPGANRKGPQAWRRLTRAGEEGANLHFDLARKQLIEVSVYDAQGRLAAIVLRETLGVGSHEALWDGLMENGQPAPAGIYLMTLQVVSPR